MFNLKKTILYLLLLIGICIFCFKCAGKTTPPLKPGDRRVLVKYVDTAGNPSIEVLLQKVVDTIQTDSVGGKSKIVRAELWGLPIIDTLRDAARNPIIDTVTQKPRIGIVYYVPIPKERVLLDISNKNYDSLMKKEKK